MKESPWRTLVQWHGPLCHIQKTHKVFESVISAEILPDWTEKDGDRRLSDFENSTDRKLADRATRLQTFMAFQA